MPSLVTNVGLGIISARLKGSGTEPVYLAWGTGPTAASATATALSTEASEARIACVTSIDSEATPNDTWRAYGTMTADGTKTITNWGLFDASVGGNLLLIESIATGKSMTVGMMIAYVFRVRFARGS